MDWNLEEAMDYYAKQGAPSDQSALIALLREVQERNGCISSSDLARMCGRYQVKEGLFLALIRRIPSLRLEKTHILEVCCGPNCSKKAALADFAEKLPGITVKRVPCLRQCGKGPNIRFDGQLYNKADETLIRKLLEGTK